MSKAVAVSEFKSRFESYLREVRRGETIVITDRGEPVAELRPITMATGAEIDRLVALGRLTRASATPLRPFRPIRQHGPLISKAIVENRENRF